MQTDIHSTGKARFEGNLELTFSYDQHARQTRLARSRQQAPLRVIRPFPLPGGAALLHLHNVSGGVLGGDRLRLNIEVGPEASVQLTSVGATRVYRSRPASPPALQEISVRVDRGGLLEYLPDTLIPFAGARYQQYTTIELVEDAGLFWWEIIAPGRTARGELFAYELLSLGTELRTPDRPLLIERMKIEPAQRPSASPARMGPYTYMSSFYICRPGLPATRWNTLERTLQELAQQLSQPGETLWGVSTLVADGLVVRALSTQGRALQTGLHTFWERAKMDLYGQKALLPRKIY